MPVEDMRRIAARLAYGLGRRLQWQRRGRGSYPLLHGFLHRCMQRRLGLLGLLGFRRPVIPLASRDDEPLLLKDRRITRSELEEREHAWEHAYLSTPHGQPVKLR
jgi:hypothetical protein